MLNKKVKALTALLAICSLVPVLADTGDQDLDTVIQVAETFAIGQFAEHGLAELKVTAVTLDDRLKLKACQSELEAFGSPVNERSGRTTVGIRCLDEASWTLYVPVKISASIPVLTAISALPRGHVLQKNDLTVVNRSVQELPGQYMTRLDDALNKELTRQIPANVLLTTSMLREPMLINKGQSLTILAGSEKYAVKMGGTALADGSMGERINVKNLSSGKTIQATIIDASTVQVNR